MGARFLREFSVLGLRKKLLGGMVFEVGPTLSHSESILVVGSRGALSLGVVACGSLPEICQKQFIEDVRRRPNIVSFELHLIVFFFFFIK